LGPEKEEKEEKEKEEKEKGKGKREKKKEKQKNGKIRKIVRTSINDIIFGTLYGLSKQK
jgi:hypothetical protein